MNCFTCQHPFDAHPQVAACTECDCKLYVPPSTTCKPVQATVKGDWLIQEFEYTDGPLKGERFKVVTKMLPGDAE